MKTFHFFILCLTSLNLCQAEETTAAENSQGLKPHEVWWENCLGTQVSLDTFRSWHGNMDAESRIAMRNHVKEMGYTSILDVPSGACVDYWGLKTDQVQIAYQGADITPKLVQSAQKQNIPVVEDSVEDLSFPSSCFDVTYSRHLFEHLSDYQQALNELIRVSKKEVMVVFFQKPKDAPTKDGLDIFNGYPLYHQTYNKPELEKFILDNPKVARIEWQDVNPKEAVLHIYLKTA